jgi:2-polyprenylphenol 6-hydroxylase
MKIDSMVKNISFQPLKQRFSVAPDPHVPKQSTAADVCVLGAGPVAAVSILLARQLGLRVIQLAPMPSTRHQAVNAVPRTYAISPAVQMGLARLGVWDLIPNAHKQVCTHMQVFWQYGAQYHTESYPLLLSADLIDAPQLCTFVTEDALQAALNTALTVTRGQQSATLLYEANAVTHPLQFQCDAAQSAIRIQFVSPAPSTIQAHLCIIAEGATSHSAASLGLAPTVFDYAHHAVVAEIHAHLATDTGFDVIAQTAWQWLGDANADDVLALLPMGVNAATNTIRYGLVWSQASSRAAQYVADPQALLVAVQQRIKSQAPQLLSAGNLTIHSAVQQFPLFKSQAPRYVMPHMAMVGDAVHKVHPLAGQGLNMGFEDAFALFNAVSQRESWRGVGDARVLARYQRQRMAQAMPMDALIHAIARRNDWLKPFKQLVTLGLQWQADYPVVGKMVRKALVRHATHSLTE